MKIIQVVTIGNTLPFLKGQVAYLRARGHEVVAVATPGVALDRFGGDLGIRVVGIGMQRRISPVTDLLSLFQLWNFFLREKPDVVHTHTPKAGLLGTAAAWLARVPVKVFHIHGLPYLGGQDHTAQLLKVATSWSCRLADMVWSVSPSIKQQAIEDRLIEANRIEAHGAGSIGGIDAVDRFVPVEKQKQSAEYRILFAGRLAIDKGIREVGEAWRRIRLQIPGCRLVLAGELDERDAAPGGLMDELRSDPRVELKGWVDDMRTEYARTDLVWLPTYREGLGMVLIEAAAMQIPVVASDVPGCRDAVVHGVTGLLIPPKDVEGLVEATLQYANCPELARKHGKAGRERVLRDFAPLPLFETTEKSYVKLLEDRKDARSRRSWAKRLIDVTLSAIGLLVFGPLMALAAILVRTSMGPPILFRQYRPGLNSKSFEILKFRTMSHSLDAQGSPLPDGQRLTSIGAWLRKTSIDELPELWNVLRGDMSLVGPRPLLLKYTPYFSHEEQLRFQARPGITGWAQIHGRNYSPWSERLANDVWYVKNWSVGLDLRILLETIVQVFSQRNIAVDANTVMLDLNVERSAVVRPSTNEATCIAERSC